MLGLHPTAISLEVDLKTWLVLQRSFADMFRLAQEGKIRQQFSKLLSSAGRRGVDCVCRGGGVIVDVGQVTLAQCRQFSKS